MPKAYKQVGPNIQPTTGTEAECKEQIKRGKHRRQSKRQNKDCAFLFDERNQAREEK